MQQKRYRNENVTCNKNVTPGRQNLNISRFLTRVPERLIFGAVTKTLHATKTLP